MTDNWRCHYRRLKYPVQLTIMLSQHPHNHYLHTVCTIKQLGWYLNFSTWFIKKWVLLEQKKKTLWNKQHFVENKTEIMQKALKCSKFSCCLTRKCNTQTLLDLRWGSVHKSTLSEEGSSLHIRIDCLDHMLWLTLFYWFHVAFIISFSNSITFLFLLSPSLSLSFFLILAMLSTKKNTK